MHDIGSTQTELIPELDGHEMSQESDFEAPFEFDFESNESYQLPGEAFESPFSEAEEADLAGKLLDIGSERELDYFLGSLIKKAGQLVGKVVHSPIGKALGGALKGALKTIAPIAGGALGTFVGGPAGAALGSSLASMATKNLEVSQEQADREFEVARRFVRLAGTVVNRALQSPEQASPPALAQQVLSEVSGEWENYASKYGPSHGGRSQSSARYRQRRSQRQSYGRSAAYPPGPVPPWAVSPYIIPAWACANVNAPGPADGAPGPDDGEQEFGGPPPPNGAGAPPQHRHHLPKSGRWYRRGKSIVLVLG